MVCAIRLRRRSKRKAFSYECELCVLSDWVAVCTLRVNECFVETTVVVGRGHECERPASEKAWWFGGATKSVSEQRTSTW